jgi:molybdenum cofactor cytidylyltransferase
VRELRFAAVVLAAGKSERMGRNKLLLEVDGRPILDRLLSVLDASAVNEVFVILGHRPEELRAMVEAHRAEIVLNHDYEKGMTSSFKAGLRQVSADAAFLILGDQFGLEAGLLDMMAAAMESDQGALIVSPVYQGRRGHPVLFRRMLFAEILSLGEGETLRDLVQRHEAAHRLVEGSLWCVVDLDTPQDYERAKKRFEASRGAEP